MRPKDSPVIRAIRIRSTFSRQFTFNQLFFLRSEASRWLTTLPPNFSHDNTVLRNRCKRRCPVLCWVTLPHASPVTRNFGGGDGLHRGWTTETRTDLREEKLHRCNSIPLLSLQQRERETLIWLKEKIDRTRGLCDSLQWRT